MLRTSDRRGRRTAVLVAVLACALAAASCTGAPPDEERQVQDLVRTYNARLAEGFRTQDMNALGSVATRDQAQTEYHQMAALGEGKVRLLPELLTIRFVTTAVTGERAVVQTEETWDYVQVSTETSEVLRTEHGVAYVLRYELVRRDGRWFVDKVTSIGKK